MEHPGCRAGTAGWTQCSAAGLCSDALTLITGAPGTGKTLLAQQFVFSNAAVEHPALYVSTVSEPLDKILR